MQSERETTKARIAHLRAAAERLRHGAQYAERYQDGFADRKRAAELEAEAKALEAQLLDGEKA